MKKFLLTLCALLMAVSGAWADDVTVTICDNKNYCEKYGTWSNLSTNYTTFTTIAASGLAGVTITSEDIDGNTANVMNQGYYSTSYKYTYQVKAARHNSYKIKLTAPEGYIIKGYNLTTMKTSTNQSSTNCKVTAADGNGTAYFNTANGTNLSVSGLNGQSTYFTVESYTTASTVELNIFNFTITVAEASSSTVDVTYKVVYGGEVVNTSAETTQNVGDAPSLPLYNKRAYCTYTYYSDKACASELTALTAGSTEVYAKCTYSGPFNFASSASDATTNNYWTALKLADTDNYVYCNNLSLAYTKTIAVDNKYQWAIIGNPYGYRLYNRGAGDANSGNGYLNSTSVPTTPGGTTSSFNFDGTGITFELFRMSGRSSNDEFVSVITETNTNSHSGTVLNHATNLLIWCGIDNSSFYCYGNYMSGLSESFLRPAAVPSYSTLVTAYITPWYSTAGEYFSITSAAKTALDEAGYTAALSDCDEVKYNALLAIVQKAENIKYPALGFYRIKNNKTNKYIAYNDGLVSSSDGTGPSSVIYLNGSNGTYKMSVQGLNVQQQTTNDTAFPATSSEGKDFKFAASSPCVAVINNEDSYVNSKYAGYLHEGNSKVVNWQSSSDESKWVVEAAEDVTLSLTAVDGKSYGTAYLPFDVTLDAETAVTANTLTKSGNMAVPTNTASSGKDIPAGKPVMLYGSGGATSVVATITSGLDANDNENLLSGTYTATTLTDSQLTLGQKDNVIGFYLWTGNTLGANKAYIPTGLVADVKALSLNFDNLTGISSVEKDETKDATIYNLAGQRVQKATHGLYIINGKKVVIK